MHGYHHKEIEQKWQQYWSEERLFEAEEESDLPKYYPLIEFPYPSGAGLHVGHPRPYIALDIVAHKKRREGHNVLYPIGWDAFGLPTENYAIKTGKNPKEVTKENTDTFRRQIQSLGISFDWSREINTTDPSYYRWTQWIFLQLYKNGLAYKAKTQINWCPRCKIGLANEEVVDGACERCGESVEKREREQWMLAITKYAQRLYDDLEEVDYIERAKTQQRNWIGPSKGAELSFPIDGSDEVVKVFTTRPDTLYGATYLVLAPEHPLVASLIDSAENREEILRYREAASKKNDIERSAEGKEKTGVELKGVRAINPATKEEISVWIADYVLASYGTGAIMAVPAHDERDFEFAEQYHLPVREVIEGTTLPHTEEGALKDSGEFSGMDSEEAKHKITEAVGGEMKTTYKLRDWVFSRQRYWGEPIPMIHCEKCGWVPVPEESLPVLLPEVEAYQPTDTGDSPLAAMDEWVETKCPSCGGAARRETDVMPNWAGSSWYYLRYADTENNKALAGSKKLEYWTPVDWYNGGMEHTVLHLLYSRFWHKFLFDIGVVPTKEPYKKRTSHGIILAEDGSKMSKSKGNVVNPDEIVERFGADTLRIYEMFMGPFDQAIAWSTDGLVGARRFLERVVALSERVSPSANASEALERTAHISIKKIDTDIEELKMNTAISQLMIFGNALGESDEVQQAVWEQFLLLLAPFAPHLSEELWQKLGEKEGSIHSEEWPKFDPLKIVSSEATVAIQVGGKMRDTITIQAGSSEEQVVEVAKSTPKIAKWIEGQEVVKVVYVPDKLLNLVVKPEFD